MPGDLVSTHILALVAHTLGLLPSRNLRLHSTTRLPCSSLRGSILLIYLGLGNLYSSISYRFSTHIHSITLRRSYRTTSILLFAITTTPSQPRNDLLVDFSTVIDRTYCHFVDLFITRDHPRFIDFFRNYTFDPRTICIDFLFDFTRN